MAQVRSANGLRGILKFLEILGSTSYFKQHVLNMEMPTPHLQTESVLRKLSIR